MEEAKNLLRKLALVMADVSNIPKNGVNPHFGYKYVRDTDVALAVHNAFVTHDVVMIPSMTGSRREEDNTVCNFIFTLYDAESGESIAVPWEGEAYDQQDKGINKAATAALKYFLLKLFLISTGDLRADADAGPKEFAGGKPAAPSRQKTPTGQPGLRVITFGKHNGKTLDEIARDDKSYLNYLVKSAREPEVAADAVAVLEEATPEPEKHWIETEQNIPYFKKLNYWGVSVANAKRVLVGEGHDIREYKGTVDDALKTLKEHIDSGQPGL